MALRIALYARVAASDQVGPPAIERQVEGLRAFAEEHGWSVRPAHIYRDESVSGLRLRRPGLDRLLTAVARGGVDVVLAASRERLARDESILREVLDTCEAAGCRVEFAESG